MRNQFETTIKLQRIEICDLLIACLNCYNETNATKWLELHNKLNYQLNELDEQLDKLYDDWTR